MKSFLSLRTVTCRIPLLAALCLILPGCKKDHSGPEIRNDLFSQVTLVASGGAFHSPSSSVPDASNQYLYFIAEDAGGAGVFQVPANGGTATALFVGAPFIHPKDLVLSTDNQTLFVADPDAAGGGAIFYQDIHGGMPAAVPGTAGTRPQALDLLPRNGQDHLYYCGRDAGTSGKAIFEISSSGASNPMLRYKGAPLIDPSGIVAAKDGRLYFADGAGVVYRLDAANVLTRIASGILMGSPAGIALTPDEGSLAVSSKSTGNGSAQVQLIDLQTGSQSLFNKGISSSYQPGGLHAARNATGATGVYAWSDATYNGGVYRLRN